MSSCCFFLFTTLFHYFPFFFVILLKMILIVVKWKSLSLLEISDYSHNKTMLTFTTTKCHSRKRKDFMCFVGHYTFSLPFQKALKEWRNSSHKSKLAKWHTRAASDKIIISTEWNHQTMLFDSSKLPSVSYTHTRFGFINI